MGSHSKRRKKPDGPVAALCHARQLRPDKARPTFKRMRELRAGEKSGHSKGHLAVVSAFKREISRNLRLLERLNEMDPEIVDRAIACFGSPEGAAAWLTQPEIGLNRIPVEMPRTQTTKRKLMELLARIDYGLLA